MGILSKLWYGQYSLARTFWGFYVGGTFALSVLLSIAYLVAAPQGLGKEILIANGIWGIYLFIASVGVWISARRNLRDPFWLSALWGILARLVILVGGAWAVWGLAQLGSP